VKVTIDTARGVVTERDGNGIAINGPLTLSGPVTVTGVVVTGVVVTGASATVSASHTIVATAGNCALALPDATTVDQQEFKIKKISTDPNALTISPSNGQTIDGQTSLTITAQYTAVTLYALGGAWYIF
jgi:hypothetical protein